MTGEFYCPHCGVKLDSSKVDWDAEREMEFCPECGYRVSSGVILHWRICDGRRDKSGDESADEVSEWMKKVIWGDD